MNFILNLSKFDTNIVKSSFLHLHGFSGLQPVKLRIRSRLKAGASFARKKSAAHAALSGWKQRGSNPWPPASQASALPAELCFLLCGTDRCRCSSFRGRVDLAGIEPASESLSIRASPITVISLTFPLPAA